MDYNIDRPFEYRPPSYRQARPFEYRPPSYRQAIKDGSGTFWNLISVMFGGKQKLPEYVNPTIEALRKNAEHYRKLNEAAAISRSPVAPDAITKYIPLYGKRAKDRK